MLDFILKVLLYLPWLLMAFLAFKFCQFRLAGFAKPNVDASGKWVLVTGAASGIGRATALAVLRYGGSVYAADVNEPALKQAFAEYGPDRVVTLKLDVTDGVAVKALAQLCAKTGLHGVVNSAGVAVPPGRKIPIVQSIVEADVDVSVLPVLQINTVGTMRVNNAVFDLIFKSAGVFVNIASVSGRLATPGMGAYSVSKFGVVAYSNCMRRELAPCESHCGCTTQTTAVVDNIRVVCIEPGFAKTAILDGVKVAPDVTKTRLFERSFANAKDRDDLYESIGGDAMQSADDVAAHILTALFSSQGAYATPRADISPRQHHWFDVVVANMQRQAVAKAAAAAASST